MLRIFPVAAMLAACSAEAGDGNAGQSPPTAPGMQAPSSNPCAPGADAERCADFLPQERMRGVWITGFEQSAFLPGDGTMPDPADPRRGRIWLDFADGSPPDPALRRALDELRTTVAVAIEFDGRRTRAGGGYGHLGGADQLVMVDRIVSVRILGPLPRG